MPVGSPRRYSVSANEKAPLLKVFVEGLRAGGAAVLEEPDPSIAPFHYRIATPAGEPLRLIAYIFRAKKYHSGAKHERPADEHRFQIKYGSDFTGYHYLELPKRGDRSTVTLFLGVHLEENLLVGCDPTMHNPTWFSKSVEIKEEHLDLARKRGWYGWERQRVEGGRRKQAKPLLDYRAETIIAFTPQNLVRFIDLERKASGLDSGERLLLAETPAGAKRHALELELEMSSDEIMTAIQGEFRLKVAMRGSAAQVHLHRRLEGVPGISKIVPIHADSRPDFEVQYRHRKRHVTIECKNVLRSHTLKGLPIVEYQKTRASLSDPVCGRFYTYGHCDILAACMHPFRVRWEYEFCPSRSLPEHSRCSGRVHPRVPVGGGAWTANVENLLDEISGR